MFSQKSSFALDAPVLRTDEESDPLSSGKVVESIALYAIIDALVSTKLGKGFGTKRGSENGKEGRMSSRGLERAAALS